MDNRLGRRSTQKVLLAELMLLMLIVIQFTAQAYAHHQ